MNGPVGDPGTRPVLHPESVVVTAGRPHTPGAPLATPIVLTAPYRHGEGGNAYARHDVSETVAAFETAIGALEGGAALAFASGMAAVTTAIDTLLTRGSAPFVAVAGLAGYSGTVTTFDELDKQGRLTLRRVDPADTASVVAALDGASLVWLETVTNPLLEVADLQAIIPAAHAAGAVVVVDATFSTPLVVRPLELGADVVMHSATKYLSGHSDVLLGVLVTRSPELRDQLHARRTLAGAIPGALESYLALRGLRTLALRMERAQQNAMELARRLHRHPRVTRVRYPGLPDDPGHEVAARTFAGYGAIISFEVAGSAADAEAVCAQLTLITDATSLGGVESLIERRAQHAVDAAIGTPPTLLRLSVGIEHTEDLWADLSAALSG